jgi:hypothetical protein
MLLILQRILSADARFLKQPRAAKIACTVITGETIC